MEIFGLKKRYRKRIQKKFEPTNRIQVNFMCDSRLAIQLKVLAHYLEVPIYPLIEHLLQLGLSETAVIAEDEALRERFCRHLVEDHLLTPVIRSESEPISHRALKIQNAMRLLELLEDRNSPEEQRDVILRLMEEMRDEG